jgi:ferritin-like metal-binding protein YciE
MKTLKELFLNQLADMYDAERRIVKALPKMAMAATCDKLRKAFQFHLKETQGHVSKLEQVFQLFDVKAKGQTCKATVGLLEEGDEIATDFKGSPTINAGLISAAQKVEHHEMAAYGCLHEWATLLGNKEAAGLLQESLIKKKPPTNRLPHWRGRAVTERRWTNRMRRDRWGRQTKAWGICAEVSDPSASAAIAPVPLCTNGEISATAARRLLGCRALNPHLFFDL